MIAPKQVIQNFSTWNVENNDSHVCKATLQLVCCIPTFYTEELSNLLLDVCPLVASTDPGGLADGEDSAAVRLAEQSNHSKHTSKQQDHCVAAWAELQAVEVLS